MLVDGGAENDIQRFLSSIKGKQCQSLWVGNIIGSLACGWGCIKWYSVIPFIYQRETMSKIYYF